LKTKNMSID